MSAQAPAGQRLRRAPLPPLARYILIRLGISALLIFGVTVVTFLLTNLVPADPAQAILGDRAAGNPEIVERTRQELGLDKPLIVQYFTYLGNLLQGDLGVSNQTRQPVAQSIANVFPASIELGLGAILISVVLGLILGLVSALKRNTAVDHAIRAISLIGISAPTFWIATVAYFVFFFKLRAVPGAGRLDPWLQPPPKVTGLYTVDALAAGQWPVFVNALSHLVLPSIVLSLFTIGLLTRFSRSSVLDVVGLDYVTAARAKGLPPRTVIFGYIFRGALVPIITVVGLAFGSLLSGAVLTETVFAWNGLGQYAYRGATKLDLPVIMGVGLVIGIVYIGINFLVDLIYGFIDPRVRVR
ncbi:ABC transporter permease subunit [Brevibacterium sp. 5221]|uniref:ABC transporter permease subunit n=1 Tax=Brevibacterium rongguiense TaxID=2695267 RepID=A0A6N9H3V4_9MICO|nr:MULTISPECIES: ABC transporter permease [Brevibacterium]MYM18599.1 ABC transporter permease subunit [Brevibacterium rongguiense]WAL41376.1 ABC transporter permease [Brevibacterium sp. BRM-1]